MLQCLEHSFEYGFEYQGACTHEVITPLTERTFLTLIHAIKSHMAGLCMGVAVSNKVNAG